jgi:chromosome segregation ATPase
MDKMRALLKKSKLKDEERRSLDETIAQIKATKTELVKQIRRQQNDAEQFSALREMIQTMRRDQRDEELRLSSELSASCGEIKEYKRHFDDAVQRHLSLTEIKLADAEADLGNHVEAMDSVCVRLEQADLIWEEVNAQAQTLFDRHRQSKKQCMLLGTIYGRTPRLGPVWFRLADLESEKVAVTVNMSKVKERIEANRVSITRFGRENDGRRVELQELSSTLASLQYDLRMNELQANRMLNELDSWASELSGRDRQQLQLEHEAEEKHRLLDRDCREAESVLQTLTEDLNAVNSQIESFPTLVKAGISENEIMIAKRKQLIQEITKKIEMSQQEIIQRRSQSPEVMELTRRLEADWREHARLTELAETLMRQLKALQDSLDRKKSFAKLLPRQNFAAGPTGLRHLDLLYNAAMSQNRDMAEEMRTMRRELNVLEAEKLQFEMVLLE